MTSPTHTLMIPHHVSKKPSSQRNSASIARQNTMSTRLYTLSLFSSNILRGALNAFSSSVAPSLQRAERNGSETRPTSSRGEARAESTVRAKSLGSMSDQRVCLGSIRIFSTPILHFPAAMRSVALFFCQTTTKDLQRKAQPIV